MLRHSMPVAGNLPSPLRIRETSTAARQHSTRTKWIPQWHVLFGSDLPFQDLQVLRWMEVLGLWV